MMSDKVIIIGAGIAGLTAGCYAQLNGYETEIHEMHTIPGGLCTAWKRQGYTFDGCIHWLLGSNPNSDMHKLWRKIGALSDQPIIDHQEFVRVTDLNGRTAIQYTDLDRLEQHLLDLSPEDKEVIQELIKGAKALVKLQMPVSKAQDLYGAADGIKMLWSMRPFLGVIMKYSKISIGDFTARFRDPLLKELFTSILDPQYNMIALLATMGSLAAKDAGWPQGGSLKFALAAAQQYKALGGTIYYNSKVNSIIIEDNRAIGVELADGTIKKGRVISAADGYTTLFKMLGKEYVPEKVAKYYTESYPTITSVLVYLGVDHDFSGTPHSTVFQMSEPMEIGGRIHNNIGFKHYSYDATMSPPGKSVVCSAFYTEADYWQEIYQDKHDYDQQKAAIAAKVIAEFEKQFPEAAGKVEVSDVVTPMTFTRYTGVWKGAYMSWISTVKGGNVRLAKRLPGLKDFYMAGLWTMGSAGLPGSSITARDVVQIICAEDKKTFVGE